MNRRRRKKLLGRLFGAIQAGDVVAVKALLGAGVDPEGPDSEGTTPLYAAAVNGEAVIVGLLLSSGASPDVESRGVGAEGTALCAAACWGHTGTVRELLAFGADPNLREDGGTGWSPLEWANNGPHPETVDLLVAAGADAGNGWEK
ncbi:MULTISPECIES: ankyrin repeat domain-containing protein [unclassified Streptomyces]|uniref:ankyrin repeat domain-containing protein n=1 Tax=unclassified Streptomyces TaxID=2593676 RepID=UPI002E2BB45F|nr:ankyrin repeat domain-containing protein [Streptomyces sp. NBC_00228]